MSMLTMSTHSGAVNTGHQMEKGLDRKVKKIATLTSYKIKGKYYLDYYIK